MKWTEPGQKQAAGESVLILNLFDDAIFKVVLDRREVRSKKSAIWLGHIERIDKSQVTLVIEEGVIAGNIDFRGVLPGALRWSRRSSQRPSDRRISLSSRRATALGRHPGQQRLRIVV